MASSPPAESNIDGRSKAKSRPRKPESPEVVFSKALSKILRHRAKEEGLQIRADGFVPVDELLKRPKLKGLDFDSLQKLVNESDKQRFAMLSEVDGNGRQVWWIKANQGHSIELDDLELKKIERSQEVPIVLHGTFKRFWPAIAKEGLKRMTRTHIHCASGRFGEDGVISGVRKSCDLFIYIDVARAMSDSIEFFISPNGVVLTKGIDGVLPPTYFAKVVDRLPSFPHHVIIDSDDNEQVSASVFMLA